MMETFQEYNVEFVSSTEKFDTSTPMGRAMLNICIVFAPVSYTHLKVPFSIIVSVVRQSGRTASVKAEIFRITLYHKKTQKSI